MTRIRLLLLLCGFLFAAPAAWADPPQTRIDPAARAEGERLRAVVAGVGDFRLIEATREGFALRLRDGSRRSSGVLRLHRVGGDQVPRFRSRSYSMEVSNFSPHAWITEHLIAAAWAVARGDGGAAENPHPHGPREDVTPLRQAALGLAALAALLGVLRWRRLVWEIRLPHLLPSFIQFSLFVYWSLYWPAVRDHAPAVAWQLALAFAADAAFSFARVGTWRVGASPLPVVLSSNLFVWFNPRGAIICILVAFATKAFYRRGGRHVLNPSAIGLTVTGVLSYVFPGFISVGGLFHTMSLAPNMAELMVLLAIVPQTRFRILPLTIAAVVALRFNGNPAVLRPPIILAVALLATDPSTIPKTDSGKALFGLTIGYGLVFFSELLRGHGMTDDFAKVMTIPLANVLVPVFDRLGSWFTTPIQRTLGWGAWLFAPRALPAVTRPLPNTLLVVAWLSITVTPLGLEKPEAFEAALHWNLGTPHVVRDADDVPRCEHNPVFCEPFSFARELALWRHPAHQRLVDPSQR